MNPVADNIRAYIGFFRDVDVSSETAKRFNRGLEFELMFHPMGSSEPGGEDEARWRALMNSEGE